jgi:hypothetical protein
VASGSGKLIRIAIDFLKKVRKRSRGHHPTPTTRSLPHNAPPGLGPLRPPARPLLANEGVPLTPAQGLQSRTEGLFTNVTHGTHGDAQSKYLWTIDHRGVNAAPEMTPFPTPRGNIVHTNLSSEASIGGEAWFGPNNSVTINAGSGRFGDGAGITPGQWDAASQYWRNLGYDVTPIPFGQR